MIHGSNLRTLSGPARLVLGLGLTLACLAPGVARAQVEADGKAGQGPKTVLVASLSGYDDLIADLKLVGKMVERPSLSQTVEGVLAMSTGGRGLLGVDTTKPWGLTVLGDGPAMTPLAFLPLKKLDDVLKTLAPLTNGKKPTKDADGVYAIVAGQQTIYLKEQDGWAFLAQQPESLEILPADPEKLLADLSKDYDVAIRILARNIDEFYRNLALSQVRQGVEGALRQEKGVDDEEFAKQKAEAARSIKQMESLIAETDTLTIGLKIDGTTKAITLDLGATFIDGGKYSRQIAQFQRLTSKFAGFLSPDAALRVNATFPGSSPDEIEASVAQIEVVRTKTLKSMDKDSKISDRAAREAAKSGVSDLFDVAIATVKEGTSDGAAAFEAAPDAVNFVAGIAVANGADVEKAIKKLEKAVEENPDFEPVAWNVEEHAGVRFHRTRAAVKKADERRFLGDKVELVVGIGEKSVYFGAGRSPIESLKKAIDASAAAPDQKVAPFQLEMAVEKFLALRAGTPAAPGIDGRIKALADGGGGKDKIRVRLDGQPNGLLLRVELEGEVLHSLAMASPDEEGDFEDADDDGAIDENEPAEDLDSDDAAEDAEDLDADDADDEPADVEAVEEEDAVEADSF